MQKYIDEYTLLAEAKMMYQDCHESYILVEGKTDKIFFTVLMGSQSNIRFRPVSGWERVHKTILLAQKEGFKNILGIMNCTPFVRQYGILFRKWGVFVCQRDNESATELKR